MVGERISLGNFSADFDWSAVDKTAIENGLLLPTYDNIFYHEQYYRNGSVCELSGLPRRTLVKVNIRIHSIYLLIPIVTYVIVNFTLLPRLLEYIEYRLVVLR